MHMIVFFFSSSSGLVSLSEFRKSIMSFLSVFRFGCLLNMVWKASVMLYRIRSPSVIVKKGMFWAVLGSVLL